MTLHSAKGLEFPVVFIVGLNDGTLPHIRSFDDPEAMQEERRLLYVGITRAKDKLYLLHSLNRYNFGYAEPAEPSRYLDDIPMSLIDDGYAGGKRRSSRSSIFRPERWDSPAEAEQNIEQEYAAGMRVGHSVWGDGMVLNSKIEDNEEIVDIFFEDVGLKRVVASLAKLTLLS
jgi:DNA helicase-2/ATP-dependent DNA helicase PcrA